VWLVHLPKLPWIDDFNGMVRLECQQVNVRRHQTVGSDMFGERQDAIVQTMGTSAFRKGIGFDDAADVPHVSEGVPDELARQAHLSLERHDHFLEQIRTHEQAVSVERDLEKGGAQSAGSEGGDQNSGVEDDVHDISRSTSSSVSSPSASASGRMCLRSFRKRRTAI